MSRNQGYRVPYSREAFSSASAAPPQAAAGADPRHGRGRDARGGQDGGHCLICSFTQEYPNPQVPVYHRHFSSLRLREMTGVEDSNRVYLCPSCKSHHQPYPNNRIKVVVSDSTLHEFYARRTNIKGSEQYRGDIQHVDYVTIPGATLETLTHAFRLDYMDKAHDKPLDVVLVGGYNDLVMGKTRDQVNYKFQQFCDLVKLSGIRQHPNNPNTVAVATLMYPPQLAWFPDNGPPPSPDYVNQREKIDWLNNQIQLRNRENGVPIGVGFHTYGVRKATRQYQDQYGQIHQYETRSHRWEHWREEQPDRMLHMRDHRRFKMGTALNNYFVLNTEP